MDPVAFATAVGGAAVGLAGVLGNSWNSWVERKQANDLAAKQHEHEGRLSRGDRLYERRAPVYEVVVTFACVVMDRIENTEPIISFGEPRKPQEPLSDAETQAMQVRLRTYGSTAIGDAFDEFADQVRGFWGHAFSVRTIREQGGQADLGNAYIALQESREGCPGISPDSRAANQ